MKQQLIFQFLDVMIPTALGFTILYVIYCLDKLIEKLKD